VQTRAKTSQAARAGSSYKQKVGAIAISGKAERRRTSARSGRKPLMFEERGKENDTESDDVTNEEEDEAGDLDVDDSDGDEEGEDGDEEDEDEEVAVGIMERNTVAYAVEERDGVGNDRDKQDTEDQCKDEQISDPEEDQMEEADEEEDQGGGEGQGEDTDDEEEEGEKEGEKEGEEEQQWNEEGRKATEREDANNRTYEHSNTGGKDGVDRHVQGEDIGSEGVEEESGNSVGTAVYSYSCM
jgi:hypothetical protein